MAFFSRKNLQAIILAGILAGFLPELISGQYCGCEADLCCSKEGYCGTGDLYCGDGCQEGNCSNLSDIHVSDFVTQEFFDGIINQAHSDCAGKSFYTRDAFLSATDSFYPRFGRTFFDDDYNKREIAAFFAHATHETEYFCNTEETNQSNAYCDAESVEYPCADGKKYYGRGPLLLRWNYNYGLAGNSIGFNGIYAPETVANDVDISFKSALWFWMGNVHSVVEQGFGETIRKINGDVECDGKDPDAVRDRVALYEYYCYLFGVLPGDHLTC